MFQSMYQQMGGSPPCQSCQLPVYFSERVKINGSVYHNVCFKCSTCNMKLQMGQQYDHSDKESKTIHCRTCYTKLYGPKGYGYGGALIETGVRPGGRPMSIIGHRTLLSAARAFRRGQGIGSVAGSDAASTSASDAGTDSNRSEDGSFDNDREPQDDCSSVESEVPIRRREGAAGRNVYNSPSPQGRSRRTARKKSGGFRIVNKLDKEVTAEMVSQRDTCQWCKEPVYFGPDRLKAAGKWWHRSCFKCEKCQTPLAPGEQCDRKQSIMCKKCYSNAIDIKANLAQSETSSASSEPSQHKRDSLVKRISRRLRTWSTSSNGSAAVCRSKYSSSECSLNSFHTADDGPQHSRTGSDLSLLSLEQVAQVVPVVRPVRSKSSRRNRSQRRRRRQSYSPGVQRGRSQSPGRVIRASIDDDLWNAYHANHQRSQSADSRGQPHRVRRQSRAPRERRTSAYGGRRSRSPRLGRRGRSLQPMHEPRGGNHSQQRRGRRGSSHYRSASVQARDGHRGRRPRSREPRRTRSREPRRPHSKEPRRPRSRDPRRARGMRRGQRPESREPRSASRDPTRTNNYRGEHDVHYQQTTYSLDDENDSAVNSRTSVAGSIGSVVEVDDSDETSDVAIAEDSIAQMDGEQHSSSDAASVRSDDGDQVANHTHNQEQSDDEDSDDDEEKEKELARKAKKALKKQRKKEKKRAKKKARKERRKLRRKQRRERRRRRRASAEPGKRESSTVRHRRGSSVPPSSKIVLGSRASLEKPKVSKWTISESNEFSPEELAEIERAKEAMKTQMKTIFNPMDSGAVTGAVIGDDNESDSDSSSSSSGSDSDSS